jgi:hypothetical protein
VLPFFGLTLPKGFLLSLTNTTVNDLVTTPTDCTAGFRLGADGKKYITDGGGSGTFVAAGGNEALFPASDLEADLYEWQATVTLGSLTSGTAGSWLPWTANLDWTKTRTNDAAGTDTVVFTLDGRLIGTSTTLVTATITLNAEVG